MTLDQLAVATRELTPATTVPMVCDAFPLLFVLSHIFVDENGTDSTTKAEYRKDIDDFGWLVNRRRSIGCSCNCSHLSVELKTVKACCT